MIYKNFEDLKLSSLGMGAMRLPLIDGNDKNIDEEATANMVEYAMKQGINYYDTAWGYHGGNSEIVMRKILSKHPRNSFYLATKFPGYDLSNMTKVEEIFEKQLEKCQVDYFDFYLFHNVCEMNIDAYLDEKYKIFDYLIKPKKAGRICHLGFSAHGSYDVMKRFLYTYGKDIEFCQIQLNYLDWTFQDAKKKVDLLNEHCFTGGGFIAPMALMSVPEDKQPSACIGCRSCEEVCPQQIKISEAMADFVSKVGA